jgi:hypothetical protein
MSTEPNGHVTPTSVMPFIRLVDGEWHTEMRAWGFYTRHEFGGDPAPVRLSGMQISLQYGWIDQDP